MRRQPRGMGIVSHFKRLLEVEDRRDPVESTPLLRVSQIASFPRTTAAAMEWEQVVPGYEFSYLVHFLHSDDPRHGFTVMSMNPNTYFEFRTPIGFLETHTIVRVDPHL
jgi:hypothetical protein